METAKMTLPLPGLIDGDTDEVEELTLEALYDSMDQFAGWIDDVTKQLANAERSRILDGTPSMTAEVLTETYDESDKAAILARLNGAAKALVSAAAELRR
jgi:hypothetical protein